MQLCSLICFVSRSLNETECRYAQLEKKFSAVVFTYKEFFDYIYRIITDHKQLLGIMNKDFDKIFSTRLKRMKLLLTTYLNFTYTPGKYILLHNLLSRNYSKVSEIEI